MKLASPLAVLLLTSSAMAPPGPAGLPADSIYLHANIYTGAARDSSGAVSRAQAMAVRGDRIVEVGSEADVLRLKGPKTTLIDLNGRFVMPGFNDAHMHLAGAGFKKLSIDFTGVRSREAFRVQIQKAAEVAPAAEWLTGAGWDETLWPDKKLPTRFDIDEAAGDHPAFLERVDGHVALANTLALKLAEVTERTKDPEGGQIARDEHGMPDGILRETAKGLVGDRIPPPTEEKRRQALETALVDIARWGVTSVQDFSESGSQATFGVFEELERQGKLTTRVSEWLSFDEPVESLEKRRQSHPASDLMLHTGMLKAFMDGSLGSHTALMLAPYADQPGNSGIARYPAARLNQMAKERLERGFQLGFHAIGDGAVRMALDAFREAEEAARAKGVKAIDGGSDYRLRIEHAQVTTPAEVSEFRQLKVVASIQPSHLLTDMNWAQSRLGPERAAHSYAWAELVKEGVQLAFGTDYPVEPVTPFRGLYAAVTRKSEDGRAEYYPAQKLSIEQAIAAYTISSAFAEFAENEKGTLSPGKLADFVVLDRDITRVDPARILSTRVLRTVVGGRTVYASE